MYRNILRLSIISLALLSWSAFGNTYTGNGADDLWNTAANWSQGVPVQGTGNEWADMTVDGTICIIDSTHVGANAASAGGVYPGCYGGENELYMTGGELTCLYFNIGRGDSNSGGDGYFKITGGNVTTDSFRIPNQWASGSGNIIGDVDLHGGVVNTSSFSMGSRVSGASGGGTGSMDVAGGMLIVNGNAVSTIQDYINYGWITAYGATGLAGFELDHDSRNSGKTTLTATNARVASVPNPTDKAIDIASNVVVGWTPGISATSHDIYFGITNPPPFIRNETLPSVNYDPGILLPSTTYYWRIDATDGSNTWSGPVWEFTTGNLPGAAINLSPVNGAPGVTLAEIYWSSGTEAESHDVYFGTTNPPAFVVNQAVEDNSYEIGTVAPNTTYYWRIDERNSFGTTAGAVWSFTTEAPVFADLNGDRKVDFLDLKEFVSNWLDVGCDSTGWCNGADLSQDTEVDYEDYAMLAGAMAPTVEVVPPYTDYNAMLSQDIQGKKHGFMAGNLTYYIGGKYGVWNKYEDETIGLTHPFHHDLRSRGHGMVNDPDTGYGHDLQGWEFYNATKVAYGSVWIGGTKYTNPVPTAMYWQPDKMICEYSVGGVTIHEEKFIADNDAACTIITSSVPVTLEFEGQSFANDKTITTTATCQLDAGNNAVHVVEGGTVEVKPTTTRVATGVMMYDGMSTVISTSRPVTDYTQTQVNDIVTGQWTYSFKVPCDSAGTSLVWSMDDSYSVALGNVQDVLADPASKMQAKSDEMNDILNYQIPYFRCSDQDIVDIYYYLWAINLMYYIDVDQGWEQYPHTQSAVNNFLGMHRYDAVFQTRVGAWAADKERFANGNALVWSALLPTAQGCGMVADNMGIDWHSGIYGPEVIAHVPQAWLIYEHSGNLAFLSDAYAFYKPLFWDGVCEHWGYMFDGAESLAKMAVELGMPEDVQHWRDMVNLDNVDNWIDARWDATEHIFLPSTPQGWTSMAYMGMSQFHRDKAVEMTEYWAVDSVDGFFSSVPLAVAALKDWDAIIGLDNDFVITPDTNWYAIRGMYMHHVGNNANVCALGHLKNYNMYWGMPIAPESFDRDNGVLAPWGDQYSNFNAGKILFVLEGMSGINYSVVDDSFEVADHMPLEWDYMEFIIPINEGGETSWTKVRTERAQVGPNIEKTISVEGNTQSTLKIQPWLDDKTLFSAPAGYVDQQPEGHIDYTFQGTEEETVTIYIEE